MNVPDKAALSELDLETTILGSFLQAPTALQFYAGEIKAEWFSEPVCERLWLKMAKEAGEGRDISFMSLLNALPEDLGGVKRNDFLARVAASAIPANMLSGAIHSLKETWARRKLHDDAQELARCALDLNHDPFDLANFAIGGFDEINSSKVGRSAGTLDDGASDLLDDLDNPDDMRGPTTGLKVLDDRLNGYKRGCLYVLAGRPGMGKSAVALSSLRRTAQAGHGVAFFSLEMSQQELAARIVSDILFDRERNPIAPFYGRIISGNVSNNQKHELRSAFHAIKGLPFVWDASPRLTISEIASEARKAKAKFEAEGRRLEVLCIDHMGLVEPSNRYRGNKVAEAGEVSGRARALAKELDCCVLLLSQLSRNVENRDDKRPTMSDLRWAGEIEQDAHVVGLLYREHYYLQQDANADPMDLMAARDKLEFIIGKNRNGEGGKAELYCSIQHNAVRDAL